MKDIATYDRYVALRPSMVLDTLNYAEYTEKEKLTLAQEAIVETAKSYLLRGYRTQYDDTRLSDGGEFRWKIDVNAPED